MKPEQRQAEAGTTWDGLPVSRDAPYGTTIVVFLRRPDRPELLMLHRAHHGAAYEGDWAWTPPAGARLPEETVVACARRELLEETGLMLDLELTDCGSEDRRVYLAEVPAGASIIHDDEHDRYAWLPCQIAVTRCQPTRACEPLKAAVQLIERACALR